jgi:hypothetical protein
LKVLFAKKISTVKINHAAEMRDAITSAITTALRNGVTPGAIHDNLEGRLEGLRRMEHTRIEQSYGMPKQHVATEHGIVEVDVYAEAAKREAEKAERELREQQAAYRADLARRSEA